MTKAKRQLRERQHEVDQKQSKNVLSLEYFVTGISSWLIPGAGHFLLGYRTRGTFIAVIVLGIFWYGESVLANNMAVCRASSPFFYACQLGNGLSTIVAENLWGEPGYPNSTTQPPDPNIPPGYHLGILFTTVSGLLNMLAVLHVIDPKTWRAAGEREATRETTRNGRTEADQ